MNCVNCHFQSAGFINPPPYKEKNGGGLTAVRFLHPSSILLQIDGELRRIGGMIEV